MTTRAETRMNPAEWLLLIFLGTLWGSTYLFNEVAIRELDFFQVVFGRLTGGAVFLLAFLFLQGRRMPLSPRLWGSFLVMGFINNLLPFCLVVWGQNYVSAGLAAILNSTTPLFGLFAVRYLGRGERITWLRLGGTLLGLLGVVILIGPEILGGLGSGFWGQLAVLGGACSYSLAVVYARRFASLPPLVTSAGQLSSSALMMLVLALAGVVEVPARMPSLPTWGAVLGLALLCTAVAYIIYFRVLRTAGPNNVLLVTLLNPVSALILGALILGERILPTHLAGMALIAAALLAIDGRAVEYLKKVRGPKRTGPGREAEGRTER